MTQDVGAVEQPGEERSTAPAIPDQNKSPRAQGYNDLFNLAKIVTNTAMIPRPLRGRPDEAFAVMVYGVELGIEPLAALRSIHIIEGTPSASAQLMRALIVAHGHLLTWRHVANDRVELYGRRRDTGAAATVVWTIDDARQAKLLGKGNWSTYPRAMLAARATSELARLLFPDVLHGLSYTPEEMGAVGPYAAIDVDTGPYVDPETGEILNGKWDDTDDEITDDTPVHVTQGIMLDAEDEADAEFIRQARDEQDVADGRSALWDETDAET